VAREVVRQLRIYRPLALCLVTLGVVGVALFWIEHGQPRWTPLVLAFAMFVNALNLLRQRGRMLDGAAGTTPPVVQLAERPTQR
jgi:hypothetical protein